MLGEGPVVNDISGLFCHINEPLSFSLQRLSYLLMTAVSKGVKFLAGVAGIDGIVGAVSVAREGASTYIPDVLRIDDVADRSFGSRISALNDFLG
ncbi:Uncharacterised protein [Pseudomonas aeruginosa]|nr:Uncharacterised protein [Pseudomonas aeruginosa]